MFLVEYGFPVDLVNILVTLYVTKTRYSMKILYQNTSSSYVITISIHLVLFHMVITINTSL